MKQLSNRVTVVLRRGSKGTREWTHKTQEQAFQRACSLADLHSAKLIVEPDRYVIDASAFYDS